MINKHLAGQHDQRKHGKPDATSTLLTIGGLRSILSAGGYDADVTLDRKNGLFAYGINFKASGNKLRLEQITGLWDYDEEYRDNWRGLTVTPTVNSEPGDIIFTMAMLPDLAKNSGYKRLTISGGKIPLEIIGGVWPKALVHFNHDEAIPDALSILSSMIENEQRHGLWPGYSDSQIQDEVAKIIKQSEINEVYLTTEKAYNYQRSDDSRPVEDWIKDTEKGYDVGYFLDLDDYDDK